MFVSLNRKIIYSIILLFMITSVIFVYTFYIVYGNKIQEEQRYSIQRNQQYIDLLYKNINMTKEFRRVLDEKKDIRIDPAIEKILYSQSTEESQMQELSQEQKQIYEINKSFDERYAAIQESIRIFGISSILIVLAIIVLGYLISRWILNPINKIAAVSQKVSRGDLSERIVRNNAPVFTDELDYLIITFNQMLDGLEKMIFEVKNKEAFLQALIDSIPDGIRVIDSNYNIIVANKAYYRQVGKNQKKCRKCYEASQKLNHPCPPDVFHCPVENIIKHKHKNVKVVQQFCEFPNRHLSINAAPLRHAGKEEYVVESLRDLSEDINFSHQQKLSSLGFLSSSIAHEMKNHLGALRIITERLLDHFYQDKPDDCEEKKHLNLIYNEIVSCIAVPERLLKLTRNSGDNNQGADINGSLEDVIALLDFEAKSKGINIDYYPGAENYIAAGNEADFKMVAINIILNALKAMTANGLLTVSSARGPNNTVEITFKDTGSGIAPENLNRIFDPFFSDGQNSSSKGNGLGLSIAKSIVEKFGGHIGVESRLGEGSTFTIKLPLIKNVAKNKM